MVVGALAVTIRVAGSEWAVVDRKSGATFIIVLDEATSTFNVTTPTISARRS